MESRVKGVYKLVRYGQEYNLIYDRPYLNVPEKIYGKSAKYAAHFFNTFLVSKESCGAMLIGAKGSGKTELSNMIGNIAINHGLYVVEVTNIQPTISIINYLDSLTDCVVIFDEFGKVFLTSLQDKMLTMFSNTFNKKFFVITDNDSYRISSLLIDRPGRIRYHLDMNRVEEDVVVEYCDDKGVSKQFLNELLGIYRSSTIFSFDHLKALVSEHLIDTSIPIEDIIKILNVKILGKKVVLVAVKLVLDDDTKLTDENNDEYVITSNNTIERTQFNSNGRYYINWKKVSKVSDGTTQPTEPAFTRESSSMGTLYITNEDVIDIDESNRKIICKKDNFKITLEIKDV